MTYNPNFSGQTSAPSSQAVQAYEANNTGTTLVKLTPVRINPTGDLATVDVAIEAQALAIAGIVDSDIADGDSGSIINSGRVKDITTSAAIGDILYLSKTGSTTNVKPTVGVGGFVDGDFAIRLGIVAKNQLNPLNKDLIVDISIVGEL